MNVKPFNSILLIVQGNGWTLINGEQITRAVMVQREGKSFVTLHLSDGSSFELKEKESKAFINMAEIDAFARS